MDGYFPTDYIETKSNRGKKYEKKKKLKKYTAHELKHTGKWTIRTGDLAVLLGRSNEKKNKKQKYQSSNQHCNTATVSYQNTSITPYIPPLSLVCSNLRFADSKIIIIFVSVISVIDSTTPIT